VIRECIKAQAIEQARDAAARLALANRSS